MKKLFMNAKVELYEKDNIAESFTTPILFLIFNRPNETKQVFERIREIKPKYLYVAADGPRTNSINDGEKCKLSREIISKVDWECEVKTAFNEQNLGCGLAVSSAISWFFENVDEGIILEDDCLPSTDFFYFCRILLIKYRQEKHIMHISGRNNLPINLNNKNSFYHSSYNHIWGWATWKRAWKHYKYIIEDLEEFKSKNTLDNYFKEKFIKAYWYEMLYNFKINPIDTWDYQWTYSIWKSQGHSILPKVNLVENIGFNEEATHTKTNTISSLTKVLKMEFPIIPPKNDTIFYWADKIYFNNLIRKIPTFTEKAIFKLKKIICKK